MPEKLSSEAQKWMQKSTAEINAVQECTALLKKLSDTGFYVEFYFNNHSLLAGQEVGVGFVVGDLSKPQGQTIVLKKVIGTPVREALAELRVLCGVETPVAEPSSKKKE